MKKYQGISEEEQIRLIYEDENNITILGNLSERVQLEAVRLNGWLIEYIKNPSETVQVEAVRQKGYALQYIKNPTEKVVEEAIKTNEKAIKYRKDTDVVEVVFGTYNGELYYNKSKRLVIAGCWLGTLEEFLRKCTERIDQETAEYYYKKMKAM